MSQEFSERPTFSPDQIAALSASRNTLTALDDCTRGHLLSSDDIEQFFPGTSAILGMADYKLARRGGSIDVHVSRDYDPQDFTPLREIDPNLPEVYHGLPVACRGTVSRYDEVRDRSDPASEGLEERYYLYEVQGTVPEVGGGVVVSRHDLRTFTDFIALTDEEKRKASDDELLDMLDPDGAESPPQYSNIGGETVRSFESITRVGKVSVVSLSEVTDLTNLLRDVRTNGEFTG